MLGISQKAWRSWKTAAKRINISYAVIEGRDKRWGEKNVLCPHRTTNVKYEGGDLWAVLWHFLQGLVEIREEGEDEKKLGKREQGEIKQLLP